MKGLTASITALVLLGLMVSGEARAQRGIMWKGGGGWGPGSSYSRMYDPQTVETVSGEVTVVNRITPMRGMRYGVHLQVKTGKGTVSVHLGPGWFIEHQNIKIRSGDTVEVKGSRIMFDGKSAIIAAQVKKGDEVLTLRDENGFPVWAGWRRR